MQAFFNHLYWATLTWLTTAQATNIQTAQLDTVQFGPFYITNYKSQDQHIATLLTTLRDVLQPVITELGSSASSEAYTIFFKDIAYAPFVRDILSNIANGTSVIPEAGADSLAPRFIGVDDRDLVTFEMKGKQEDVYDFCRSRAESPALILLAAPMIFLCPPFFTFPAVLVQSSAGCCDVDLHRNQFVQKGRNLVEYQIWSIMHEMVHYYTFAKTARIVDEYGVNDCLALLGRDAIVNPNSYSYYVANVRLGCTDFPTVRTRPAGYGTGVELLEVDANMTAFGANQSDALVVQSVLVDTTPPV